MAQEQTQRQGGGEGVRGRLGRRGDGAQVGKRAFEPVETLARAPAQCLIGDQGGEEPEQEDDDEQ